jgi:hypothetical protein
MAVDVESPLPAIKLTGYRLKQVHFGLWLAKPSLPLRFGSDEKPVGKPATRRVFWSTLICSSGLLVDVVTPLSFRLHVGEIILTEITPDEGEKRDPEIELARAEPRRIADFGVQLIKYRTPFRVGKHTIRWAVLEGIWNTRGELVVRGRSSFRESGQAARRYFEEEAKRLADDQLMESYEPTSREKDAETGKWLALKDIHPKTVDAIERALSAPSQQEREKHLHTAADEFGKEFYALRKQIVWPAKQNVTPAIWPLDKVSAAERKSIGRRKPRPNAAARYMATCWVPQGVADMTAAQLTKHLNEHFRPAKPFTVTQVRKMRYRLQLFCDWESDLANRTPG